MRMRTSVQGNGATKTPCSRINADAERGQRGKDADVPHRVDQRRRHHRPDHVAQVVGRQHDAREQGRKSLEACAQADQRALQAGAQHQQRHAEQQRPGRGQCSAHVRVPGVSGGDYIKYEDFLVKIDQDSISTSG